MHQLQGTEISRKREKRSTKRMKMIFFAVSLNRIFIFKGSLKVERKMFTSIKSRWDIH